MKIPWAVFLASITIQARSGSAENASTNTANRNVNATELPGRSSDCRVQAWVRAEDLAPNTVSHGDLRIKVAPAHCATQIDSVALRLQLDEFAEVKHMRAGAVLPEIRPADNQTRPDVPLDPWMFDATDNGGILYDYSAYDKAVNDPTLWIAKAEERRVWATEVKLFQNNPNFTRPRVTPFVVASPAVNYPPAIQNWGSISNSQPVRRHAFARLGYYYTAIVLFTDGRSIEVPAGHTNFVPIYQSPPTQKLFTINATFEQADEEADRDLPEVKKRLEDQERCLPEAEQTTFVAEVTLEDGNVVQRGQTLNGRLTIHTVTSGSTMMWGASIILSAFTNHHWAIEQAQVSGDQDFKLPRDPWVFERVVAVDPDNYVFQTKEEPDFRMDGMHPRAHSDLCANKTSFEFSLKVPEDTASFFVSRYSKSEAALAVQLSVVYPREVAACIYGDNVFKKYGYESELGAADDAETPDNLAKEDALWDSFTPVGTAQVPRSMYLRALQLRATVPVIIVGDISTQVAESYDNPGVAAPAILASEDNIVFPLPLAHPVITEEPFANTSARLMESEGTFDAAQHLRNSWLHRSPKFPEDPTAKYQGGDYAGLLWKKKVVAIERGLLPAEGVMPQNEENAQHRFVVVP